MSFCVLCLQRLLLRLHRFVLLPESLGSASHWGTCEYGLYMFGHVIGGTLGYVEAEGKMKDFVLLVWIFYLFIVVSVSFILSAF